MRLDHGILNLPLHKRGQGSIDSQLDRYKKEKATQERIEDKIRIKKDKELRAKAKELFLNMDREKLADMCTRRGWKIGKTTKLIKKMTFWEPEKAIRVLGNLQAEVNP